MEKNLLKVIQEAADTSLSDKAEQIGNDKEALLKRLKEGKSVLSDRFKKHFKAYTFDFANKRLVSKSNPKLALCWFNDGRTSEGQVSLRNLVDEMLEAVGQQGYGHGEIADETNAKALEVIEHIREIIVDARQQAKSEGAERCFGYVIQALEKEGLIKAKHNFGLVSYYDLETEVDGYKLTMSLETYYSNKINDNVFGIKEYDLKKDNEEAIAFKIDFNEDNSLPYIEGTEPNNLNNIWVIKGWLDNMDSEDGEDTIEFTKIGLIDYINSEYREYSDGDAVETDTIADEDITDEELMNLINDGGAPLPSEFKVIEIRSYSTGFKESIEEPTHICKWCEEEFPESDMQYEKDMGWLCDTCIRAIESRGEELDFDESVEDDAKNTLSKYFTNAAEIMEVLKEQKDINETIKAIKELIEKEGYSMMEDKNNNGVFDKNNNLVLNFYIDDDEKVKFNEVGMNEELVKLKDGREGHIGGKIYDKNNEWTGSYEFYTDENDYEYEEITDADILNESSIGLISKVATQRRKNFVKAQKNFNQETGEVFGELADAEMKFNRNQELLGKRELSKKAKTESKVNEEYGPLYGEPYMEEIGHDIAIGSTYRDTDEFSWNLLVDGMEIEELLHSCEVLDWVLVDIAEPVKDGHDSYVGLELILQKYELNYDNGSVAHDLGRLGFDLDLLETQDEIYTHINYDICLELHEPEEIEESLNEEMSEDEYYKIARKYHAMNPRNVGKKVVNFVKEAYKNEHASELFGSRIFDRFFENGKQLADLAVQALIDEAEFSDTFKSMLLSFEQYMPSRVTQAIKEQVDEGLNIPTIDVSLRQEYEAGEITASDVAAELNKAGWTNYQISDEEALEMIGAKKHESLSESLISLIDRAVKE